MGCVGSSMSKEERQRQLQIEQSLADDRKRFDNEIKLLLLGAGESGKSTVAKQMKIIHLSGFSEEERRAYKDIIHSNVITSMRALIAAAEKLGVEIAADNRPAAAEMIEWNLSEVTPELGGIVRQLWADRGIQECFERSSEFQLNDSAKYYFDDIDRVADPSFVPNEQDVLRSRAKTTGITETEFVVEGTNFRMVDVGGQRSERKKWIHCFQDVTAVIFCVAMSEYDLKLYEDETVNRMHESLKLFDEISNSRWFVSTSIVLFLNKSDIFAEKIQHTDLKVCFSDYDGGCDFDNASKFITGKFTALNRSPGQKSIYPHTTCATDTQNIRVVFQATKDIILRRQMAVAGL